MIENISHIYLPVRDVEESIDFYTQKLGFNLLRQWAIDGRGSAYLEKGGVLVELTRSENTPSVDGRPELRLGLAVPDMDATLDALRGQGVEVVREPWEAMTFWGRQAQIRDCNGYLLSIREWRDPDGPQFAGWKPVHDNVTRMR